MHGPTYSSNIHVGIGTIGDGGGWAIIIIQLLPSPSGP